MAPIVSAWIESPVQLLGALEHAHLAEQEGTGEAVTIVPRLGDRQVAGTLAWAQSSCLPDGVRVDRAHRMIPGTRLRGDAEWMLGDPFSGQAQMRLALAEPSRLTLVDDGSITRHIAARLLDGHPMLRPALHAQTAASLSRRWLAAGTTRRLQRLAAEGRLHMTTYLPEDDAAVAKLRAAGVVVRTHRFEWTRANGQAAAGVPEGRRLVMGSAAVADHHCSPEAHRAWVLEQAEDGPIAYLPHRREPESFLRSLARQDHIGVIPAELPIEVVLGGVTRALDIVTKPSSIVDTLRWVLEGTGSTVRVHGHSPAVLPITTAAGAANGRAQSTQQPAVAA